MIPNPFAELPLAIFTTLMPLTAGAFTGMFLVVITSRLNEDALPCSEEGVFRRLDKAAAFPLVLLVIGFIGAFFHLHDALHAPFALSHIGASPLSNEIFAACCFAAAVALYWIFGLTGKLSLRSRKIWLLIISVLGILLAVFTGLAYYVETIPTWASVLIPVQMLGYMLAATAFAIPCALMAHLELGAQTRKIIGAVSVFGVVVALAATCAHIVQTQSITGAYVNGEALLAGAQPYYLAAAALALAFVICALLCLRKTPNATLSEGANPATTAAALMVLTLIASVFCARLAFYCLQISVGV